MIQLLRRGVTAPALLAVAVVLQASLVNRLPLPGDAYPNLVILVVAALAVTSGPVTGMIVGFLGGLALDIAPPGSDLVGENALVCCLVGYGCGTLAAWRLSSPGGAPRTTPDGRVIPVTPFTSASTSGMWRGAAREAPLRALPLMAASAVIGELLQAGLGMLLSDPSMTMPAVQHVLPAAVTYDIALSPFVLFLVTAARGGEEPGTAGFAAVSVVLATPAAATRARAAFRAAGAGVDARPGGATRLTFSGTRPAPVRAPARPDPKLKFASGSGPSSSRTGSSNPRTSHASRPGAGSWSGGSASGPRGSAWLRDSGTKRGAGHPGSALQRGPGQARPPKVAFGGGRRDGLIGGSVLANGAFGFGLRGSSGGFRGASGGFRGALGPSLFAGGDTRRGSIFRRGARGGAGLRGAIYRGSTPGGVLPRGSAFRGSGARSGSLGSGALAGRAAWSRGIGGRAFRDHGPGRNRQRNGGGRARGLRPGKLKSGWPSRRELGAASGRGGPGKGWLRPARPPAPIRRARPGRGWLSRKPPKLMTGKTRKGGRR